jgi:hypothetical protein
MRDPILIVGLGQLGGVFARAFLSLGHPVYPVLRSMRLMDVLEEVPDSPLLLMAVGIKDLPPLLEALPQAWHDRVGLLQNELLPKDWEAYGIRRPTVSVVWFEKKHRRPVNPLFPTAIYGPRAHLLAEGLEALDIPARILREPEELNHQLVLKNVYILTANIAGLVGDETLGGLLENQPELLESVFDEVLRLQEAMTDRDLDREALWGDLRRGFEAHPEHRSKGRSAPERLQRAILSAERLGLSLPWLSSIREQMEGD